jgi:hypothetical protein
MKLEEILLKWLQSVPETSTFSTSPYPTYTDNPVQLPAIQDYIRNTKDFVKGQKDYILSKQFPIDVTSQNVGLGLGGAIGSPFGLTLPGAIAGGAVGGFVGNRIKEAQGYPQNALSTILDTITGAIPGNFDNGLSLGLYAGKKAKGFPTFEADLGRTTHYAVFDPNLILNPPELKGQFSSIHDKLPRFEIDDSGARIKADFAIARNEGQNLFKPSQILDHPELYKNYPDIDNTAVLFSKDINGGNFDPSSKTISLSSSLSEGEDVKSKLLHELQHYIQEKEGFVKGTSPENEINYLNRNFNLIDDLWKKVKKLPLGSERDLALDDIITLGNEIGMKPGKIFPVLHSDIPLSSNFNLNQVARSNYLKQLGEIEARDVQSRIPLMGDQRFTSTPFSGGYLQSQGIPIQDFITRY